MSAFGIDWSDGALWLAASLVLLIAEMMAPGFFLVFLGVGSALTGIIALFVPATPLVVQAIAFTVLTAAAVAAGRRWYRRSNAPSPDPLLNDRGARLIGSQVEVCDAIVGGRGRVKVGDGAWNAEGSDAPVGARVKVIGAAGSVLQVGPA